MLAAMRRRLFHPLHARWTGSPRWRYWQELEQSQWQSRDQLFETQARRLVKLVSFVYENNEFYRQRFDEAGVRPQQIQSPEDLRALPILEKPQIRFNEARIISRGFDRSKLLEFRTGGSTGKPLRVFLTEECSERRNACAWRHDRWTGWEIGEPVAALWGNVNRSPGFKERMRRAVLSPTVFLDTMQMTVEAARQFARECDRMRPTLLFGHARSLFQLARIVESERLVGIEPRGVLSTSMTLLQNERKTIEHVWGVPVFDRYGCEEVSLISSECEVHRGLHLNVEHLCIEFLDEQGAPVRAGEQGRLVLTDLGNLSMPMIRYAVEDLGSPGGEPCSCGRGLPIMSSVGGREADFILRGDGSRVSGISIIENTLTAIAGIAQMQVVQSAIDELEIRVVLEKREETEAQPALKRYFQRLMGPGTRIVVAEVEGIPPSASGKYRLVISEVGSGSTGSIE